MRIVRIGEVCTIKKGTTGINKAIPGEYPLVVTSEERKSHNEYQFDAEAVVIPLVSSTGHGHKSLKRIHFQKGKFAVGSILCAVIPNDKTQLSAEYLYRYLDLNREKELVARMKGMANVTLPIKEIEQIQIPLPTLDEQHEFVKNYKALEVKSSELSSELMHQLTLVKKLRQAFLREAMQGKLVPQDPNDEPASELLKKIKAEKKQVFQEKKIKKEKELPPIKPEEIPFEVPKSWVWCRLGDVFLKITDGTHHSPTNTPSGNYKYVTAKNIKNDGIDLTNITYVTNEVHQEIFSRCNPERGDLLYIKDGATTGIVTLNNLDEEFSMLSSVALLKPSKTTSNAFLMFALRSPFFYEATRGDMYGVAITRVTLAKLQNALIPLPPIREQKLIVAKLEKLMHHCDDLEQSNTQSQTQNEQLLQQVLREALQLKKEYKMDER